MKRAMVSDFEQHATKKQLCQWLSIQRSSCYYKPSVGKRGAKPSTQTLTMDGRAVPNEQVVNALISDVFSQEFNLYGYQLSTEELRAMGYIINPKKTYRLMSENGLLLDKVPRSSTPRQWVKWRKIQDAKPMEYLCMDIKYVYIQGSRRNAFLLAIIDVATRYVVGWSLLFTMKHTDVILCLHGVLQGYKAKRIMLRTDNGSQFIAHGLRNFCVKNHITQEFTHVATPEENSYVESLFSQVEKEVVQRYEFESLYHGREVFERYFNWHNNKKRRHALGKVSPVNYWNTVFHFHPVKPPATPLSLLNKDENENLLNLFQTNV